MTCSYDESPIHEPELKNYVEFSWYIEKTIIELEHIIFYLNFQFFTHLNHKLK